MKTSPTNRSRALTKIELLVVLATLLLLAAILLPALRKVKTRSSFSRCRNNLEVIGLDLRMWEQDNNDKFPMSFSVTNGGTMELVGGGAVFPHFQVMSNELNTPRFLTCPEDIRRYSATNFTSDMNDSRISYFVGVDAVDTKPTMFLAGDRNLAVKTIALKPGLHSLATNELVGWTRELHVNEGNVLMADASVQHFNTASLQKTFGNTGVATNRLALP